MSPSSLCGEGRRQGDVESPLHHYMCPTYDMHLHPTAPGASLPQPTSAVTIHRSLSPARPDTSLPARSSFLSVISACFWSSSFCFNFSSYCSFRRRIFSST